MSLKAKLEAVIYAAEEPVTLQQLASLFGIEAAAELDWQETAQRELQLEPGEPGSHETERDDLDALNAEILDESEAEVHTEAEPPAATGALSGDEQARTEDGSPPEAAAADRETRRAERERSRRVREHLRHLLDELVREYSTSERGMEIREVAGGLRFATKPEYHDAVRGFVRSLKPPLKLTLQALETLAVVAYKQPVTAPEISEIRGVDSGGVLGSLLGRKLISTAGRKQVIGRPILYRTTKDFLMRFGLKDVGELPSIEEFEKLAGDLAYEVPEEGTMEQNTAGRESGATNHDLSEEYRQTGTSVPQADGDSPVESPVQAADEAVPVDGRLSGPPPEGSPSGSQAAVDSPEMDAAIQNDEQQDREGQR